MAGGESKFRLVRSTSGARGSQQGARFIIDEPRNEFYVPEDRQVVVYFEWEGPPGKHHFEGSWKSPDGKVGAFSDFEYASAGRRFGAYWSLALAETAQVGAWSLEARVDGEVAGTHSFKLSSGTRPDAGKPARRVLSAGQIYETARAAAVFVEKLDRAGRRFSTGSGFFVGDGLVLTAFETIDGATSLRIVLSDGRRIDLDSVLAWNRFGDWAYLRVDAGEHAKLELAGPDSWEIGETCYLLGSAAEGNRVLSEGQIVGRQKHPGAGDRLNISVTGARATGGPLLSTYGEVIGVIAQSLVPGAVSFDDSGFVYLPGILGTQGVGGSLAVPVTAIPAAPSEKAPTPFLELARIGEFVTPLVGFENVLAGTLSKQLNSEGLVPQPLGLQNEFSIRQGRLTVTITWNPQEKRKAVGTARIYDVDNKMLGESKPVKIELKPGPSFLSMIELGVGDALPGIYRIDFLLDGEPCWRTFFKLVD